MSNSKKIYFTPGPATIPTDVTREAQQDFCNYRGLDIGVAELSHRSKEFEWILIDLETSLRKLLSVPDNYNILFLHGGGQTQFSSIPMNLCSELKKRSADYIINGSWSKTSADEAEKYVNVERQMFLADLSHKRAAPSGEQLVVNEQSSYRYYCDNETIEGVEFDYVPDTGVANIPLVGDMTSNFLSKPVDVSKYGLIFSGAHKNLGLSGLTIVIVRNDLIGKHMPFTPSIQCYETIAKNKSLLNTPLTFAIYVAGLYCKWILARGGLEGMDQFSKEKAEHVYGVIDNSDGFYTCPVEKRWRSRMNVVFALSDKTLEARFVREAEAAGLYELEGHRYVGNCRASLYHGITLADVERLTTFMLDFKRRHSTN